MNEDRGVRQASAEKKMCMLSGVAGARIVDSPDGDEVHVIVEGQLEQDDMKRLKKDIETVYLLEVGEKVDYRKVSIAQLSPPVEHRGEQGRDRPILRRVAIEYGTGNTVTAVVTLDYMGAEYSGDASGCIPDVSLDEIAKAAAARAVEMLLGEQYRLQVDCEITKDRVIAQVTLVDKSSGQRCKYIGAAYRKDDLPASIARSILNALNRKIELVLNQV